MIRHINISKQSSRLERSNSVLANRNGNNNNLKFLPELTPQQVLNLRRSWKHINTKGLYDVIRRAFSKLESCSPNVRLAFQNNNKTNNNCGIMEHTRFFLSLLDRIIEGDNNEGIEKELSLIGACHVFIYEHFNLTVFELEKLGEILAEQFFRLDGIRQNKEIIKVWRTLIAHIIDYIRDGFETELRLKKRKQTTNIEMSLIAPFEKCFFKRNSMPGLKRQSSFLFNNNNATTTSSNNNNKSEINKNDKLFFKTELTNITKKLCHM